MKQQQSATIAMADNMEPSQLVDDSRIDAVDNAILAAASMDQFVTDCMETGLRDPNLTFAHALRGIVSQNEQAGKASAS